ncbi:MAG: hypothetical protein AB7S75_10905 [Desulfococcaceae bacterium]
MNNKNKDKIFKLIRKFLNGEFTFGEDTAIAKDISDLLGFKGKSEEILDIMSESLINNDNDDTVYGNLLKIKR